jgi:ElaB/YqjD/DUF883 family membrane-anchored ribosome-binding protein
MDKSLEPTTVAGVAAATMTEVVDAARDQYDSMLVSIRRSPLQSLAIAAGVGVIAALLVRH